MTELLQSVSVLQYLFFYFLFTAVINILILTMEHILMFTVKGVTHKSFFFSIINLARTCRVF